MIEDTNFKLLHICSMLHTLRTAELKHLRTQYRVSYYRKIKAAIINKKPPLFLSDRNFKWKNDLKGLNKKIEETRLASLRCQKEYLAIRKKLMKPLNREMHSIGCFLFDDSKILVLSDGQTVLDEHEWAARAPHYEATIAMNKMLSRK